MSLFEELKRRNVFRVGIAYIVAAWLLVQIVDLSLDIIGAEDWVLRFVALLLALGFIPAVIFAWAFELTPEGIKREKEVNRDTSITQVTAKKLDYVTIGLLVAVLAVVAIDRYMPGDAPTLKQEVSQNVIPADTSSRTPIRDGIQSTPDENAEADQAEKPVEAAPPKSVAVLPFVNMSDDASNEYFSDGISEEILNALAKVDDLKVAGRTSSFAFKGQNQDLREIGVALNVSHILEGSVRKAGNRVRVTAQLIKVDDGYHVWSENYDRELDDIFAIQDEISASILDQLKAHLVGDETLTVARTNSKAYDLYLVASQRIYERNEASLQMASDLLTEAISIDPNYAPAYAQLGIATMLLSEDSYGSIPVGEVYGMAKVHLDRALELDPQQAEAMAGLGLHAFQGQLDLDLSVEWLEKALAINPNLTNANVWLANTLREQGKLPRVIEILQASFARDPLHPVTFNNLSLMLNISGETDAARDMLLGLKRFLPSDASLIASIGKVEVMAGNWAEADRMLTEALEREPLNFVDRIWWSATATGTHQFERVAEMGTPNFKALALDQLGRTEEALMVATEWTNNGNDPDNMLEILVRRGRFQETIEFIESRWPSLDALEAAFPSRGGLGTRTLNFLAQAYSQAGNEDKFNETMNHASEALQAQVSAGANNWALHTSLAHHAMLAGDYESALESLNQVVEMGGIPRDDFTGDYSAFAPLRGDPRFEAILDRFHEHRNAERAELGLDPLSA